VWDFNTRQAVKTERKKNKPPCPPNEQTKQERKENNQDHIRTIKPPLRIVIAVPPDKVPNQFANIPVISGRI
jgi:hypothetical protein